MPNRVGAYRIKSARWLIPMLAILGLLMVPVECAVVHGPHSIFTPPAALAAIQHPHPPSAASAPFAAGHIAEFFTPNQDHNLLLGETPAPDASPSFVTAATIAALRAVLAEAISEDEERAGPRVVPLAATASAPGVPAVLNNAEAHLLSFPSNQHVWREPVLPPGWPLPCPEPPPP